MATAGSGLPSKYCKNAPPPPVILNASEFAMATARVPYQIVEIRIG